MSSLKNARELRQQSLRSIREAAASLQESCLVPQTSLIPHDVPPLQFSLPEVPTLDQLVPGLDPLLSSKLAPRYASTIRELRVAAESSLYQAYSDLARVGSHSSLMPFPQLLNGLIAAHLKSYNGAVKNLGERIIASVSQRQRLTSGPLRRASPSMQRPIFNPEFTPFLQKYFEYNAYPSAADRVQMAKKSMMEPRQIEVWFQNHRRRAKAEGKYLRRTGPSDPAPYEMCLKSMEEKMQPFLIPEPLRQSMDSEVSDVGSDDEEDDAEFYNDGPEELDLSDVLQPAPSRHAFPMPWSRSRNAPTAILSTQQFSFPPPEWPRKHSAPVQRPVVKMKELIQSFASFHVRDSNRVLSPPFKIATVVVLPPAPHSALVRGKFHLPPVLPTTSLNIIPAPRTRQRPFRSPSPSAQLATLVPPPRKKKVAGPPRRTPKKAAQQATSPEKSSSRSTTPLSRTPSLEASDFSPSRTPSFGSTGFSSRSSSASSGPATPVGSPAVQPLEIREYLDLFGDELPSRRSASPALSMSEKQGFEFSFTG